MKKLFSLVLLVTALAGCSKPSILHESMEDMGGAYKAMREGDNLEAIKKEWATFKESLNTASMQMVLPEDQDTFSEGMDELKASIKDIDSALAAGDLVTAQELLKALGDVRKEYHDELGVKKK